MKQDQNKQNGNPENTQQANLENNNMNEEETLAVEAGSSESKEWAASEARYKEELLRMAAELDNMRKRSDKMVQDARKYAISNFAKELLAVIDNLERTINAMTPEMREANSEVDKVYQGVDMTWREFNNILNKFNVKLIKPNLGDAFDHNFHQAMVQINTADYPEGTIAQVIQAGYVIEDRLLRPCLVAVAASSQV